MFRVPRVNVIESTEGYSVEVLGQTGILYKEGLKTLHVDSEVITGPSGLLIYRASIKVWDHPNETEIINESKREKIVDNIRRAFRFRGLEISVI